MEEGRGDEKTEHTSNSCGEASREETEGAKEVAPEDRGSHKHEGRSAVRAVMAFCAVIAQILPFLFPYRLLAAPVRGATLGVCGDRLPAGTRCASEAIDVKIRGECGFIA